MALVIDELDEVDPEVAALMLRHPEWFTPTALARCDRCGRHGASLDGFCPSCGDQQAKSEGWRL